MFAAYAMYLPIRWLAHADTQMSIYLVVSWIFPMHALLSLILHKSLQGNKWKPLVVVLKLDPKREERMAESDDEDSALLNFDEIARKEED